MERGTRETFIVYTSPIAAQVTTDLAIESEEKTDAKHDTYFGCHSTPCAINMPRRTGFSVLISKEGYLPQAYTIESLHYKELSRRSKNAVIGTTLVAGAITGTTIATANAVIAGVTLVNTGVATSAVAMTMFPVALVGTMALSVDANSGANQDFFPNPISIQLEKQQTPGDLVASKQFTENFDKERRALMPKEHYKKHKAKR